MTCDCNNYFQKLSLGLWLTDDAQTSLGDLPMQHLFSKTFFYFGLDCAPPTLYTVGVGRVCPIYRFLYIQICSLPTPTVYHMRMHRVNIYFHLFLGARCRGCMDIPKKNVASSAPLQNWQLSPLLHPYKGRLVMTTPPMKSSSLFYRT